MPRDRERVSVTAQTEDRPIADPDPEVVARTGKEIGLARPDHPQVVQHCTQCLL